MAEYAHLGANMQFKPSTSNGSKVVLEAGIYNAILEKVTAWTDTKKDSNGQALGTFPRLQFVWHVGYDEEGNDIRVYERVWLPVDSSGHPKIPHEKSAMYNRCSALFGERYKAEKVDMSFSLPEMYDSLEGLAALPTFEERKDEGFRPVELRSLVVNGKELLKLECQLEIQPNNGYNNVVNAAPLPKRKATIKPVAKAVQEEELPV